MLFCRREAHKEKRFCKALSPAVGKGGDSSPKPQGLASKIKPKHQTGDYTLHGKKSL
jgi:hypothetical protein